VKVANLESMDLYYITVYFLCLCLTPILQIEFQTIPKSLNRSDESPV